MRYDPARFALWFAVANVSLVLLYLAGSWLELPWSLRAIVDLNAEGTIPAWYNASLLLLAGVQFLIAANIARSLERRILWILILIGIACIFLSADEVSGIHERITANLKQFAAIPRFQGDHGIWVPIYTVAGVMLLVGAWPVWRWMYATERRAVYLLAAAAACMAAAVITEILGYGDLRSPENWRRYQWLIAAEEGLEMFGSTFLFFASGRLMMTCVEDEHGDGPSPRIG
jgi:hypothetical protein